ncbi:unnamed protein product [Plutella xylostella]|uniref:(diamondback moth) hypothetical protein n=1 Tax=Plutella xylostella TaxID=51655 RepID=A0A8S4FV47_PLUXY|nr:unnamed protein product [Plutella xylostella]
MIAQEAAAAAMGRRPRRRRVPGLRARALAPCLAPARAHARACDAHVLPAASNPPIPISLHLNLSTAPGEEEDKQSTSVLERQLRASALDYSRRFLGHCNTTTDIKEANFLGPRAEFAAAGRRFLGHCNTTTDIKEANFLGPRAEFAAAGRRFLGHCNTTTDIKEANFLGPRAEFAAAGSDDGSMFIWSRRSTNIVRVLRGDESIVNCVQMHPAALLLATSGIESAVRLWSPRPEVPTSPAEMHRGS